MSKPSPGKYCIVSRVTSLTGRALALNFDGENAAVTVSDLQKNSHNQVWNVVNYSDGRTQSVSPQNAPNLQIGMGSDNILKTLPAHNYVWTIRENEGVCTVQDGQQTVFWGLRRAIDNEPVSFGKGTGDEKQNWLLIPARDA